MQLPERPRAIVLSRINSMVYTNVRPAISVSRTGKPGTFYTWSNKYKACHALTSWEQYARQSKDILGDIDECITQDKQAFVGLHGYDGDGYVDRFYMIHKPNSMQDNTSNRD